MAWGRYFSPLRQIRLVALRATYFPMLLRARDSLRPRISQLPAVGQILLAGTNHHYANA